MANLPTGYTELEYIESTGAQYIDTGVPPGSYTLTFDFSFSQNGKRNLMGHTANGGWYFGCYENGDYDGGIARARINLSAYSRRTIKIESSSGSSDSIQTLTVDGQTVTAQRSTSVSQNLSVFKITGADYWVSGRLYNGPFTVELNGELFRDFVPCKNASGEVGLYDLVSKSFFGNSGTGSFVAGPEVITTPNQPENFYQSASVVLRWSPVECDGYRLYKNGSILLETTETLYIDDAVSNGQDIDYHITAYRGNLESEPKTITVHIREGYTILTPVITSAFFQ